MLRYILVFQLLFISPFLVFQVSSQRTGMLKVVEQLNYKQILRKISAKDSNTTSCTHHLDLLFQNLGKVHWATQMVDASTKIPNNLLMGMTTDLGNFDECIEVQNVKTDYGTFDAQYCLVDVILSVNSSYITVESLTGFNTQNIDIQIRTQPDSRAASNLTTPAATVNLKLQLSYCIPSTCSIQEFDNFVNNHLSTLSYDEDIDIKFPSGLCQTAHGPYLAADDWIAVTITIIIVLLSVSSTAYDIIKKESKKKILTAFSWISNGKKLFSTKTSEDTIQVIQGMRLVSMCWVIMGHRYSLSLEVPSINKIYVIDYIQDASKLTVTNATLAMDSFLLFSGLLVCYSFLIHVKKHRKSFNVGWYYIHRYVRLTPPYAVMIMLQATWLRYVSSGPLFRSTVDFYADNCKKYWWTNILYVNNYVEVGNNCLPQSWYLAIDMQLFILSPIILIPLWKLPKKWSLSLLGALICAGLITAFTISYVEKFPASLFSANLDLLRLQYYPTHTRFTPWLIGVGFGYWFYETKRRNLKLSKLTIFLGWCVSNVAMLGTIHGIYAFYDDFSFESLNENYTKDDSANIQESIYTALSRSSWSLGVGWVAYACTFGYAGPINALLTWKVFRSLSRLTYCAYLVYTSYQIIQTYSIRTPLYISELNILPSVVSDIIICLLLAAVLSLTVEVPVLILEKHVLGRGKSENKENHVETENHVSEETP